MIAILAAAITLNQTTAADFFPSGVGTKWTYEQTVADFKSVYIDEVVAPVDIDSKPTIAIATNDEGGIVQTRYYRIAGDTVTLVAYNPKEPLKTPHPILKLDTKRLDWTFSGLTPFLGDPVPIMMKGQSTPKGKRKLFGEDRECLEVILDAQISVLEGHMMNVRQVAIYAKGLGMVEMETTEKVEKNTKKSKVKLIGFEASK